MLSTRDPPQTKGHMHSESEGMEKAISCKTETKRKQEQQYSYQIKQTYEIKTMKRDKEGRYIMIKGSIQEEEITVINIYAPNIRAPQCKANVNKYERGN